MINTDLHFICRCLASKVLRGEAWPQSPHVCTDSLPLHLRCDLRFVLQVFGKRYYEVMPSMGLKSADAAYVLAFSVIMLNTDLHNTQVGWWVHATVWRKSSGLPSRAISVIMLNTDLHNTQVRWCGATVRILVHIQYTVAKDRCFCCACITHATKTLVYSPQSTSAEEEEDEPGRLCAHQPLHEPIRNNSFSHQLCPQNKKKMSLEDFARINRSTNEGEPMPGALLETIYSSIARDELKISSGGRGLI